jgi:predicted ABC-type ATPase
MAQGYKGFAQIARQANANIKAMKREIEAQELDILEPEEKEFSLSGGSFFKENPDKILAEPYEGSSAYGPTTKYRPKKGVLSPADALKEIETPIFIAHGITDLSAGQSVIIAPEKQLAAADDNLIEAAIEESEKTIVKTQRAKKREIVEFDEPAAKPTIPFEDVLRTYNKDLSPDEIKAFLWYMHSQGNTYKGKWLNILNPTALSQEQESAYINSWVKSGILFYYRSELLPAFIYLSENLYDRDMQFKKDKNDIIRIYGQEACDIHETKLKEAFGEIYANRLKLDNPDIEKRLHLKPYGEFSNSLQIKNWNLKNDTGEPAPFLVVIGSDGNIFWYSKKTSLSEWRDTKRETLSLTDAFRFWLKHDSNRPDLPYNFLWEDIFKYYLDKKAVKNLDPTVIARNRALAKETGDKLFSKFLAEVILENDRVMIETRWNEQFNSNRGLRTEKIPIAFEVALNYPGNEPVEIRDEKREFVAFMSVRGSCLSAYQVGTGKTFCAIFVMEQFLDSGQCTRPFLVVPNQVYKQFYSEMKGLLPHRKINDLYNLSKDYYDKLLDENGKVQAVEEGSISMLTYEGFERVGFKPETANRLLTQLDKALMQIQDLSTKAGQKQGARDAQKLEGLLGRALQQTSTNIEDLGFDFVCFDEAHALKNIFSQVKAKPGKGGDEEEKRGKKMYEISGSTSTRGIKAYMLCSYIQKENRGRNVLLLTATPFTNSPLEVYSMLSLVAYSYLESIGLANINDFFDNYCQMSYELVINSKLQPVRKQIFKAFDNLQSLQKLVYKYMLHKEAGKPDANGNIIALVRPDKWVLPYKGRFNEKNEFMPAKEDELIDTVLPLSSEQKGMMEEIISYVEGEISYSELAQKGASRMNDIDLGDEEEGMESEETVLDESSLDDNEKAGVKTLRGVNFARSLALSPYLYEFSGLGEPDYKNYIEKSPKLKYIMECVKSVKLFHESKNEAVSGQVIYMDRGKKYFELIKDYLVNVIGFKAHEIGIIRSGKEGTAKHKDEVKNGFNGLVFNENTKSFTDIPDDKRIKIIIGTSSIREGLNLQRFGTVLYNAFVDWNPTDEIQLEGRVWRQGNSFKNVRIVLPMMSDSMDIFMFEKLEQKTERINSIWNHDGNSNVLKVEELDPREQKLRLVTNPRVIAELEVEGEETKIGEDIADVDSKIDIAKNVISFYDKRTKFEKELMKVLSLLEPGKEYASIDVMIKSFEALLTKQEENREFAEKIKSKLRTVRNQYEYEFIRYDFSLNRSYSYGNMKAAVVMLKKARKTFLDKYNIPDYKEAVQVFINDQSEQRRRMQEDKDRLKSPEYLNERAEEIERERKERKVNIASVDQRVKEFEKLNYLLSEKRDKELVKAEEFIYTEIEGCPPIKGDGKPDVSPDGIKKLELCLDRIPQTKDLNTDESGVYTENRQKLHKVIKGKLRAGMRCTVSYEKPIAILLGGTPGSGKTSWLRKYAPNLEKEKIFRIDADEIRAMLPEYKGWNSKATHKETQDIYRGLLQDISEGKPCRFDILWDGTMNKAENYLPLIGDLRKLNYEIFMVYLKVPWEVSRKRTLDRYVRASHDGEYGRYVPMQVVDDANKNGGKAFENLKHKADGFMVVDGVSHEIIERGGRNLLEDRGYFDHEPTEKDVKVKTAGGKAAAMKQRIRILKLKEE